MYLYGVWKDLADKTLETINKLIEKGDYYVDVKKLRKYMGIDPFDRSKINFIWRFLSYLKDNNHLELIGEKPVRKFKLPSNIFFLFEDQAENLKLIGKRND